MVYSRKSSSGRSTMLRLVAVICLVFIGCLGFEVGEAQEAVDESLSQFSDMDTGFQLGEDPPKSLGVGGGDQLSPEVDAAPALDNGGFFNRLADSPWFAVGSGLASFAGVLLTLYQLKVRPHSRSRLRFAELPKVTLIAAGVGLSIFAGISFYSQDNPPGFRPFRLVYDFMHGTCANEWRLDTYRFGATFQTSDEQTITVTSVAVLDSGITRIDFEAHCGPVRFCRPLPDPAVAVGSSDLLFLVQRRNTLPTEPNNISGYVDFPSVYGECGVLRFWDDHSVARQEDGSLGNDTMKLSIDGRARGTSVWASLCLVGLACVFIGSISEPLETMQRQLLEKGAELRRREARELAEILDGRSYEEISTDEKLRFDDTRAYYQRNLDLLFERAGYSNRVEREE